jgi:hypothetical protein
LGARHEDKYHKHQSDNQLPTKFTSAHYCLLIALHILCEDLHGSNPEKLWGNLSLLARLEADRDNFSGKPVINIDATAPMIDSSEGNRLWI